MENKKPNVFAFRTKRNNRYMYDACTNRVFPAPKPYYEIMELYSDLSRDEIIPKFADTYGVEQCNEAYNKIDSWVKNDNAFFNYDENPAGFTYTENDLLSSLRRNANPHLILGVTEDCNFRCKYCVYSGQYENFRTHTHKYMAPEVAKKAVDYFLSYIADNDKASTMVEQNTISFYGGEPLLAFPFIKELVTYVVKTYPNRPFDFRMTTNGYLLNDTIIDFLAKHNCGIAVSLDGPENEHDRNRVLAGGEKTFKTVFNNIQRIRHKYPDYFKKKVLLQVSFDWKSDLHKTGEFFDDYKKILPKGKTFSQINSKDTKYYSRFTEEDHNQFLKRMTKLKKDYISYLTDQESEDKPSIDAIFRGSFFKMSCRTHQKRNTFTGICSPGSRLFVSIDGTFHLCERINNTFPIGNCDTGFDFEKIYKLKKDFHEAVVQKGNCSTCIARQSCPVCFVGVADNGCFSVNGTCESIRHSFKLDIAEYYSLFEENPKIAKKFLQDASFIELH